jgi:hypothetical protein
MIDFKIIRSVPGFEGRGEPSRLLSSAGPGLRWRKRIAILGKHLWIAASWLGLALRALNISDDFDPMQFFQTGFQLALFRDDFLRQYFGELLVEFPKLFEWQRVQIWLAHRRLVTIPGNRGGSSAQESHLRLRWAWFPLPALA